MYTGLAVTRDISPTISGWLLVHSIFCFEFEYHMQTIGCHCIDILQTIFYRYGLCKVQLQVQHQQQLI